jgi:cytochrome c oxidase cbb3-type subunit 3
VHLLSLRWTLIAALTALACTAKPKADANTSSAPPAAVGLNTALITDQRILAGGVAPPLVNIKEKNPYAGDTASAKEGKALFQSMNCDGCHGPTGEGAWAPSIISGRWRYGGSDPTVFQTIFYGRPRGMPAYGGMLGPDLTWKLVTFLRSVPAPKVVPTQAW